MRIAVVLVTLAILNKTLSETTDGDTFLDKFRYGIELVRRLYDGDKGHIVNFFPVFEKKGYSKFAEETRDDFASNLLGAIVKSIVGSQNEMARAGIKISVLVAKIISDAFSQTGRDSRSAVIQDFSPLNTLLQQNEVKDLILNVRDPYLVEKVAKEFANGGNECLLMLLCKITPIAKGMQKSLDFFTGVPKESKGEDKEREAWAKSKPIERMYHFMPGMGEFIENCDICDDRYPLCEY